MKERYDTSPERTLYAKSVLGDYPILVGYNFVEKELLLQLGALNTKKVFIITDEVVQGLHTLPLAEYLVHSFEVQSYVLPIGEVAKSLTELKNVLDAVGEAKLSRKTSCIVAIGGGVVGDLAGFAASIVQRGLPLIHVPTTLLAQVDSSVGGKTAINTEYGKNLLGTFYSPRAVIIDTKFLETLPVREVTSGFGEILKYGLISNGSLWKEARKFLPNEIGQGSKEILELIKKCVRAKLSFFERDEFEHKSGIREILNFGHTFAHALESATNYSFYRHGEAVILGMRAASFLSRELQTLSPTEFDDIEQSLSGIAIAKLPEKPSLATLEEKLTHDKKHSAAQRFILLSEIGNAFVNEVTDVAAKRRSLEYLRSIL